MFRKIVLSVLALMVFSCGLIAYAGEKKAIEIDVPYVEGKVNLQELLISLQRILPCPFLWKTENKSKL